MAVMIGVDPHKGSHTAVAIGAAEEALGLNLAIHDGTALAQVLAATIEQDGQPHTLDQYEQACRPLAEKLLEPELPPA